MRLVFRILSMIVTIAFMALVGYLLLTGNTDIPQMGMDFLIERFSPDGGIPTE